MAAELPLDPDPTSPGASGHPLDANQPAPLFAAMDAALGKVVGHRLFTLKVLDHANGEAARVYTSDPVAYPVAGRKRSVDTP